MTVDSDSVPFEGENEALVELNGEELSSNESVVVFVVFHGTCGGWRARVNVLCGCVRPFNDHYGCVFVVLGELVDLMARSFEGRISKFNLPQFTNGEI